MRDKKLIAGGCIMNKNLTSTTSSMPAKPDELMEILTHYAWGMINKAGSENILLDEAHTTIRELQKREGLSERDIKIMIAEWRIKHDIFISAEPLAAGKRIAEIAHAIHEAMVKKGEGK